MIRLNGIEYEYRRGLSLCELVNEHNTNHTKLEFGSSVVIVNSAAVPEAQAPELLLNDNDTIFIVPELSGG